jgi:hypothetical protein
MPKPSDALLAAKPNSNTQILTKKADQPSWKFDISQHEFGNATKYPSNNLSIKEYKNATSWANPFF